MLWSTFVCLSLAKLDFPPLVLLPLLFVLEQNVTIKLWCACLQKLYNLFRSKWKFEPHTTHRLSSYLLVGCSWKSLAELNWISGVFRLVLIFHLKTCSVVDRTIFFLWWPIVYNNTKNTLTTLLDCRLPSLALCCKLEWGYFSVRVCRFVVFCALIASGIVKM